MHMGGDQMSEDTIFELIEKLREGELDEWLVLKEDFLEVRKVIVAQGDFKHFRGIAKHGGHVLYQYTLEERS
jgi:hypothetical protein